MSGSSELPPVGGAALGRPRILSSDITDMTFAFSVEEYLLQSAVLHGPVMYLWRPAPVIAIGRHQNPWKECVLAKMEEDGVQLVRRHSGGGAVFMDPGTTTFTFLSPAAVWSIDRNFDIVLGALRRCGVQAERTGRNDMMFDGHKISGSAFKHVPNRGVSLHHGTVMLNADMQALQRYLTPDKRKLQAKGITSVGARVKNLRDKFPALDHEVLCQALIAEFCQSYKVDGPVPVEVMDKQSPMAHEPEFLAYREQLERKEWNLGRTPEFSHKLETRIDGVGIFDVHMQVTGGKITEAVIFSDGLFPNVIEDAMQALVGVAYGRQGVRTALDELKPRFTEPGPCQLLEALTDWLFNNLDD